MITCPIPDCDFAMADDTDPILAAAQLNLHALTHTHAMSMGRGNDNQPPKQKPPKISRPTITKDTSEEDWNSVFK